ncbi:MAG: 16S rRNA (adenine(1518)-N(6)/adenine(1519)-N(6))-dimethyltransferase RsmA [Christensenella sp.]|uniref:16S rRNA (adenine(1518)-N(6)/adenine(1519)-N(6))- dimethyltransferase RsmA n=1 Tax=Christensenella sp. TaxID=1935934 RepID=UPI002B21E0E6|nr:16S rRNA (adenine(1518)-N(6)/adenine(1519)-N(6))-dimethyltransferase RsmA [Christensenella sp.]MEA5002618.1 16S rRNA (adenine(1518)-N(6)/adenine(1519)-N(6))-dimethyltransferase RsmA [Christensenella sp.]
MINVTSPRDITLLLKENGLSPLKKFGQNFLCDENIVNKIADSVELTENDYVLEIGTGLGALTRALARRAKKVVSVEIDTGLIALHAATLGDLENVTVIEGDVLKCDLGEICRTHFHGSSFHVCGNLPYYITSKILMTLLEDSAPILSITAMVQKEVAQRLSAQPGDTDYSALTASCLYYGKPETLFEVSRNCFYPAPDVDSAIIRFALGEPACDAARRDYVRVVRAAFSMRRKTLFNNLKALGDADTVITILKNCNIDPKTRAQCLSPAEFCSLAKAFFQK